MPVDGFWPLLLVPAIAVLSLLTRAVTVSGAVAGMLVAAALVAGTGWPGLAMLAALLVTGTLASARHSRKRDAFQVACNGGVAAAAGLAAGLGASWGVPAMAGALSASLSDTVAGELGSRWGGEPRALLFFRPLPRGADGAMTWLGTVLGALAALVVPATGLACGARLDLASASAAAAAGFAGNLADSVVGLSIQPRLGRRGNDWTNLLSTLCGALLAVAFVS